MLSAVVEFVTDTTISFLQSRPGIVQRKICYQAESRLLAFLGMKLGADHVVAPDCRGERLAILHRGEDLRGLGTAQVIAVHEISMGTAVEAVQHRGSR